MKTLLLAATLALALLLPSTADANLNAQYPTDEDGALVVPQISDLASTLVGRSITVHCVPPDAGMEGWSGQTFDDDGNPVGFEPDIYLGGDDCGALDKLLHYRSQDRWFAHDLNDQRAAAAILAITHEASHIKLNQADEGIVECYAVYHVWNTIRLLHLGNRDFGLELMWDARNEHLHMPDDYQAGCDTPWIEIA